MKDKNHTRLRLRETVRDAHSVLFFYRVTLIILNVLVHFLMDEQKHRPEAITCQCTRIHPGHHSDLPEHPTTQQYLSNQTQHHSNYLAKSQQPQNNQAITQEHHRNQWCSRAKHTYTLYCLFFAQVCLHVVTTLKPPSNSLENTHNNTATIQQSLRHPPKHPDHHSEHLSNYLQQ